MPVVRSLLRRRYGSSAQEEWLEDATQDALIDLYDYWQHLASSHVEDGRLNFNYAIMRAVRFARQRLRNYTMGAQEEQDNLAGLFPRAEAEDPWDDPTAEQVLLSEDMAQLEDFLNSLAPDQLREWFDNLDGTIRDQAERQSVSRGTAHNRRKATQREIATKARAHGLTTVF